MLEFTDSNSLLSAMIRSRTKLRFALRALLAAVLVLLGDAAASACPSCKEALASHDRSGDRLVQGFFYSIMFMLAMPFVTLGGLGGYFYLLVKKARRNAKNAPAAAESMLGRPVIGSWSSPTCSPPA